MDKHQARAFATNSEELTLVGEKEMCGAISVLIQHMYRQVINKEKLHAIIAEMKGTFNMHWIVIVKVLKEINNNILLVHHRHGARCPMCINPIWKKADILIGGMLGRFRS